LQSFTSLLAVCIICGYLSLVTTLIAVACSQFDKLKGAILDIGQDNKKPRYGQEEEQDNTIVKFGWQKKLNACIRHHQDILE